MAHGRAPLRSRLRWTIALVGLCPAWLGAYSALAASTQPWLAPTANTSRPQLKIDTSGALGLAVAVPTLAAGDQSQRTVTLQNQGTRPIALVALTINASGTSPLAKDPRNALRVRVDACSRRWQTTTTRTLRCPGKQTTRIAWKSVSGAITNRRLGSLPAHGSKWLRITTRLPSTATTSSEGATTKLTYRFTASS